MKRKLADSIFFNYLGTTAAALGPLLTLPVYLSALGTTQWGMMSVVLTVLTLAAMTEGGLSQVLVREFALRSQQHGPASSRVRSLLVSCQLVYGLLAATVALVVAIFGASIVRHGLKSDANIGSHNATYLLMASSLLVGVQFFAALPRSLLLGLDRHRALNISIAIAHLVRYGFGALVVVLYHSLHYLLLWYGVVAVAEGAVRYRMAWRAVRMRKSPECARWSEIKPLIPGGLKMFAAVMMSGLTTQLDKLILMRMVSLDQLGLYAIGSSVALGLLSIGYPLIQAIFPTLLALHESNRRMRKIFLGWFAASAVIAVVGMALYIWLGESLLFLWLRNREVAVAVYPVLLILLLGTMLNMMYQVGYMGWMLEANYRLPLLVNTLSVILMLGLAPLLIKEFGVSGAAGGWLAINTIGLLTSLSWFRKII